MKIESSIVSMKSDRSYLKASTIEEKLITLSIGQPNNTSTVQEDNLTISPQSQKLLSEEQQKSVETLPSAKSKEPLFELSDMDKQKIRLLQKMMEAITGKKMKFLTLEELGINQDEANKIKIQSTSASPRTESMVATHYSRKETMIEKEQTKFGASGIIRTEDGREINFGVQLSMNRAFTSSQSIEINKVEQKLQDPLVLNFNASMVGLTEQKYQFDLDSDGTKDQISFVKPGSGFLAVDWNKDGQVTDGSELFGVKSGDGFADLSQHDADQNGWIDENDEIFNQLRIWEKDERGQDHLVALGEKGVGAIYLGNVSTEFSLTNKENQLDGQIRSTGIFLNEKGTVGTVQHVDLAL